MIMYLKDFWKSTKKPLLKQINKNLRIQSQHIKIVLFLYTRKIIGKQKYKNTTYSSIKNMKYLGIHLTKYV